ncbi:hypothetical protein BX600DRAFT_438999 [Xylariales sp. PMI_506]|nr:hypothetical protein BX600DRAFT_438999 [Xylariales sp. PMI_506]
MLTKLKKSLAGPGPEPKDDREAEDHAQSHSLTTILPTHEDRANLLILVSDCMTAMGSQLSFVFDPDRAGNASPTHIKLAEYPKAEQELTESKADPAIRPPATGNGGDEKDDEGEEEKAARARNQRKKDLSKPEIIELKEAALEHFNQWRDNVLQRVAGALNHQGSQDSEEAPKGPEGPPSDSKKTNPDSPADQDDIEQLQKLYPPQTTTLTQLGGPHRILILHSILLLLLGLETYQAHSRVLMLRLTSSLLLPPRILAQNETVVAKGLLEAAKHMSADAETQKKRDENSTARKLRVGLGAAAGAVLIGVTGGLAAPLLAAGVGSVMGGLGLGATAAAGYLGALAGSAPLVGILFGAYGGKMTGEMIDEYAKQVEDFAFVPVAAPSTTTTPDAKGGDRNSDTTARHLRVAICISGWLTEAHEVERPWQIFQGHNAEVFALRWELQALLKLGNALMSYVTSYAWSWAKKELISRTIFATLASALTLPYGIAKAARVIDNPFSVAKTRSDKAGKVLADALINKVQGERPVTLLGYSLGARVIYSCLAELADRKAFGLIESVCFIGAPVPSDDIAWRKIRSVVAGRVVNVYSENDYLLALLYRTSSLQYGIAGLRSIREVCGVENVDVSELVDGHTQYRFLVGGILQDIRLEDIDPAAVKQQITNFRKEEDTLKRKREMSEAEERADEKEPVH